jgi:hypothetical protein
LVAKKVPYTVTRCVPRVVCCEVPTKVWKCVPTECKPACCDPACDAPVAEEAEAVEPAKAPEKAD